MPEVSINASTGASPQQAWAFIEDMDNWAPFLTGYQSHRKLDDRRSLWSVKGELGGLTRVAEFEVTITEWTEPRCVAFELQGLDEPFKGGGTFRIAPLTDFVPQQGEPAARPPARLPAHRWIARLRDWAARRILSLVFTTRPASVPGHEIQRDAGAAAARTALDCTLALNAGGGSGPIMNMLLAPMLPAIGQAMSARLVAALDAIAAAPPNPGSTAPRAPTDRPSRNPGELTA